VDWMTGRSGRQSRRLQAAAEQAVLAGQEQRAQGLRRAVLDTLINGDCPAAAGLAFSREALAAAADRRARGHAAAAIAFFATLLGQPDDAGPAKQLAERLAAEVRSTHAVVQVSVIIGAAELSAGDLKEALRLLSQSCRELTAVGYLSVLSSVAALHAHALLHDGQVEAARSQVETALTTGSSDDAITQGLAAAASAWLAALDGNSTEARRCSTAAIAHLASTDDLESRGLAYSACAHAATVLHDQPSASRHRQAAVDSFAAKGNVVATARQRSLL